MVLFLVCSKIAVKNQPNNQLVLFTVFVISNFCHVFGCFDIAQCYIAVSHSILVGVVCSDVNRLVLA